MKDSENHARYRARAEFLDLALPLHARRVQDIAYSGTHHNNSDEKPLYS